MVSDTIKNNGIKLITMNQYFTEQQLEFLHNNGYVVIEDVITKEYANQLANEAIQFCLDYYPVTEDYQTWTVTNMPYIRANGVIQWGGIPHCEIAYKVRELMIPYFIEYHGSHNLITSFDGATISPPRIARELPDWAHLDKTTKDNEDGIISDLIDIKPMLQGQMVLSDTNASFVCTPGSHLLHNDILDKYRPEDFKSKGFLKFTDEQVTELRQLFGNDWQVPIIAPAGSIILWDSRLIHSSRLQPQEGRINGRYNPDNIDNWRVVFYCCCTRRCTRRETHTKVSMSNQIKGLVYGNGTNHSSIRRFPKHGARTNQYSEQMLEVLKNPPLPSTESLERVSKYLVIDLDILQELRDLVDTDMFKERLGRFFNSLIIMILIVSLLTDLRSL